MGDFIATLTTMTELVIETAEEGSPERAEGLRHIVRLIEMQNGRFTDDADPANPFISRCPGGICKLGMDNPDFTYQAIEPVSAEYVYRVTGNRGTVPYITMQVFEGALGGEITMTSEDLVVDDDGRHRRARCRCDRLAPRPPEKSGDLIRERRVIRFRAPVRPGL